jgi:hypothetical protein
MSKTGLGVIVFFKILKIHFKNFKCILFFYRKKEEKKVIIMIII